MNIRYLTIFLFLFILSCDKDNPSNPSGDDGYNRSLILTNWADNVIIPAHNIFLESLLELEESIDNFLSTQSNEDFNSIKINWFNSYKYWQHIEIFNIGKAEEIYFKSKMNIYPTNSSTIENNIDQGSYDLTGINFNISAQGFPALDYMLYGLDLDTSLVYNKYIGDNDGYKYRSYLKALITEMVSVTNNVVNDWNTSYRNMFIQNSGNSVTSSFNQLTNDFIYYYEKGFRANKFGIPAGVYSNELPQNVEAFYRNNISKDLALESLNCLKNLFTGYSQYNMTNGPSFNTYIDFIQESSILSQDIMDKFDLAYSSIINLDNSFSNQIQNDNFAMLSAFDVIQQGVIKLKVDMMSCLNISVDYVDADGD